jgi:hypothetical protein
MSDATRWRASRQLALVILGTPLPAPKTFLEASRYAPLSRTCSSQGTSDETPMRPKGFGRLLPSWSLLFGDRTNDQRASTCFDERRMSLRLCGIKQFLNFRPA